MDDEAVYYLLSILMTLVIVAPLFIAAALT